MRTITQDVIFKVSNRTMSKIEDWLKIEHDFLGDGFYCNIDAIKHIHSKGHMAVIIWNNLPVGFMVWDSYEKDERTIEIAEIHPRYRSMGLGGFLLNSLEIKFEEDGVKRCTLECAPASSEAFWKSNGFIDYPEDKDRLSYIYSNKRLFKDY
jgi:GNAT superfamily N-acetyltransferase